MLFLKQLHIQSLLARSLAEQIADSTIDESPVKQLLVRQAGFCGMLLNLGALVLEQGWDLSSPEIRKAEASCLFHFPQRRVRDHGSFIERMKPLWDALVRLGVLSDDNLDVIGWPTYRHVISKPALTMITIQEVE